MFIMNKSEVSKKSSEQSKKSALTGLLLNDEDSELDFRLMPPDKFTQAHLYVEFKIFIGGKEPVFVKCELSRNYIVDDVIRHVLTLYRKSTDL